MELTEKELARKEKIRRHLQDPDYYPEKIFKLSNSDKSFALSILLLILNSNLKLNLI